MGDIRRLAVAAIGLALLAGCKPSASPAPAASQPVASPPVVSTPPTPAAPSSVAAAPLVLGPAGIGALRLGMTREQAEATGLTKPFKHADETNCAWTTTLVDAPATDTTAGTVLASDTFGVAAIFAYGSIGTPEHVKLGSTSVEITKAYPGASLKGSSDHGNVFAKVPGNGSASYRFELLNATVTEVALLLNDQNCTE
jgi:hypothetical protein